MLVEKGYNEEIFVLERDILLKGYQKNYMNIHRVVDEIQLKSYGYFSNFCTFLENVRKLLKKNFQKLEKFAKNPKF